MDADPLLCARIPSDDDEADEVSEFPPVIIGLQIPTGTPVRIAVDQRARVAHVGEVVHGKVVETVYAFDQPVIPAGSEALGRVTEVASVSAVKRTLAYANGNFSPAHKYQVVFDVITLPDGKLIPIHASASMGMARPVHLEVHAAASPETGERKNAIAQSAREVSQEAKDKLHEAVSEVTSPGRMHRLKKFMLSELPYRHQYVEPGTRFNAALEDPLDFGRIMRRREELMAIGSAPAPGSTLHARLVFEVSSATATRGNPVAAVLTEPLYSEDHRLVLPVNSLLIGQVLKATPAHKLHRNGELRLIFERIETPDGQMQSMQGNLEGLEMDRSAHVKLDEEGGAHGADSNTRYLSTGLAVALAAVAAHPEAERGAAEPANDPGVRAGAGDSGLGLLGGAVSLMAKSTPVSAVFGAYGASMSLYSNFLSRGHDVVLLKDTPVEIGFGSPHSVVIPSQKK